MKCSEVVSIASVAKRKCPRLASTTPQVVSSLKTLAFVLASLALGAEARAAVVAGNLKIAVSNGKAGLQWSGTAGARYQVECAPALGGPWTPVDAATAAFAATNYAAGSAGFYRVALFTNTAAYLANYLTNSMDTASPPAPG